MMFVATFTVKYTSVKDPPTIDNGPSSLIGLVVNHFLEVLFPSLALWLSNVFKNLYFYCPLYFVLQISSSYYFSVLYCP